jgi:hypothetical protein
VSPLLRRALLALAALVVLPVLAAPASAAPTAPTAAQGVACVSTRSCTPAYGGALMTTTRNSCTAGLPVRTRAGRWYIVTAGHCVAEAAGRTWYQSGRLLGVGTRWEYGGRGTEGAAGIGDAGAIQIAAGRGWSPHSRVVVISHGRATTQPITTVRDARVGEQVCVTGGRTGGTQCGRVVLATTSLSYASPGLAARTIRNLALVKGICVNPGDSGSPVFAGRAAVGIAVARSSSGCYTWYTKLPAVLRSFALYVG